jgi:transcription initiation factor TFIIIB Brf1 subunit/transcription initiation factor TFIIB
MKDLTESLGSEIGLSRSEKMKHLTESLGSEIGLSRSEGLRKLHNYCKKGSKGRHLKEAESLMRRYQNELHIIRDKRYICLTDRIMEEARDYYYKIYAKKLLPDMPIKFGVGISVYLACSVNNYPITIEDIVEYLNHTISVSRFRTHLRTVKGGLNDFKNASIYEDPNLMKLSKQAESILNSIPELPDHIRNKILDFVDKSREKGFHSGFKPSGFVAAVIHGFTKKYGIKIK